MEAILNLPSEGVVHLSYLELDAYFHWRGSSIEGHHHDTVCL